MPYVIGSFDRDAQDDYSIAVSFASADVFDAAPISSAVVTASPSDLSLGAPSVADNVATFRVYGGAAGTDYLITVRGTNSAGTPAVLERHLRASTR